MERPHARTRDEVVRVVALELKLNRSDADEQVCAVFRVLTQCCSQREIRELVHLLPSPVRAMWPLRARAVWPR